MKKLLLNFIRESTLITSVLFVLFSTLKAETKSLTLIEQPLIQEQPARIVERRQADLWSKREGFDAEVLTGNVIFFHEGAYMYCDSAYLYQQINSFEAFSNVTMEQGDTIFVYGDENNEQLKAAKEVGVVSYYTKADFNMNSDFSNVFLDLCSE